MRKLSTSRQTPCKTVRLTASLAHMFYSISFTVEFSSSLTFLFLTNHPRSDPSVLIPVLFFSSQMGDTLIFLFIVSVQWVFWNSLQVFCFTLEAIRRRKVGYLQLCNILPLPVIAATTKEVKICAHLHRKVRTHHFKWLKRYKVMCIAYFRGSLTATSAGGPRL